MSVTLQDEVKRLLSERKVHQTYSFIVVEVNKNPFTHVNWANHVPLINVQDLKNIARDRATGMPACKLQAVYEYLAGKPLIREA